jgi:hypothetical protein
MFISYLFASGSYLICRLLNIYCCTSFPTRSAGSPVKRTNRTTPSHPEMVAIKHFNVILVVVLLLWSQDALVSSAQQEEADVWTPTQADDLGALTAPEAEVNMKFGFILLHTAAPRGGPGCSSRLGGHAM